MRVAIAAVMVMLLALSTGRALADPAVDQDPFSVAPDRAIADATTHSIKVTVVAAEDVAVMRRPSASLIVYRPDGTMMLLKAKRLHAGQTTFRLSMSRLRQPETHLRLAGTYLVFACVAAETVSFGMPTSFDVAPE
jgi:hypothetical protein